MRTLVAPGCGALRRRRRVALGLVWVGAASAASLATWASGCSLIVESSQLQCREDGDCLERFGADSDLFCRQNLCVHPSCARDEDCKGFGERYETTVCVERECVEPEPTSNEPPEWICLDEPTRPMDLPGPFQVSMHLQHMVSQAPMKEVKARVCRKLDVNCDNPESMATSDANGDVTVQIKKAFTGYVALSRDGLMPTLYFFNPAIDRDMTVGNVQLAEPAIAKALTAQAGAPLKDGRGLVLFAAYNCQQVSTAGIQFGSTDADDETKTFYSSGGLPSSTVTETEMSGFGGFINAPAGIFSIEGHRSSDGRTAGRTSVLVKANELTITRLVPTP